MSKVYIYVVDRDFGFAPNPFHGVCTLATCKPRIRSVAKEGDWVIGVGGSSLRATGRCIYFMQVTGFMSFNDYWSSPEFRSKRPVRNGSRLMMMGDNIYHRENEDDQWTQEDSHHSNPDGTTEWWNVEQDTGADRILHSSRFVYFGKNAIPVPEDIFRELGYKNGRNHRTFQDARCRRLLEWIENEAKGNWNTVLGDPFQFHLSSARYSKEAGKIVNIPNAPS
jgi:hypothetical protein